MKLLAEKNEEMALKKMFSLSRNAKFNLGSNSAVQFPNFSQDLSANQEEESSEDLKKVDGVTVQRMNTNDMRSVLRGTAPRARSFEQNSSAIALPSVILLTILALGTIRLS